MMLKKIRIYTAALLAITFSITLPVSAHQSPAGCNSNRLTLSLIRDKLLVEQGDTLTYTVTLSNLDAAGGIIACDIDAATVTLTLPALDGTPTGQVVTLASGASYPAGTPVTVIGTVPWTVDVNTGVVDATAEAAAAGTLHDAPANHAAQISKTIGTTIVYDTVPPTTPPDTPNLPGLPNTASAYEI
jgi:uncharacterized repeat protein (TIGR01451 family)